jgi:arabinogalactan endo-1,4-beta-galactosidase
MFLSVLLPISGNSQTFYFGNDLSYVNEMEDCGAVYKEKMQPQDPFKIFANHGANLVRVRLWNDPSWWQDSLQQPPGVKSHYSDFADVRKTISRAKSNGMQVMLDLHLSDFWADPSHQVVPQKWLNVAYVDSLLADSVYNYVFSVLSTLDRDTLMPEIVKVGNETNPGMMIHAKLNADYTAGNLISYSWARQAKLYNAAFKAIRDVSKNSSIKPKICLHYAGLKNIADWYQNVINYGITDFDIIGFSYYYSWHGYSIKALGDVVKNLRSKFSGYQVMAVETGYLWSTDNFDAMANIITTPDPQYLPVCPEKQLEYMVDYTRTVMKSGGCGVIFWEPAWVSTPCRTPWGIGSSQDHVAFFDPVNINFMENGGGRWAEHQFYQSIDSSYKVVFKVWFNDSDSINKAYLWASFLPDSQKIIKMLNLGNNTFSSCTWVKLGDTLRYFFLSDSNLLAREAIPDSCIDIQKSARIYVVENKDTVLFFPFSSCSPIVKNTKVKVTFKVDMTGKDVTRGVFITGSLNGWTFSRLTLEKNNIYSYSTTLNIGDTIEYYFIRNNSWNNYLDYRETVPSSCALAWNTDRQLIVPEHDTVVKHVFSSCDSVLTSARTAIYPSFDVYPNPSTGKLYIKTIPGLSVNFLQLFSPEGEKIKDFSTNNNFIDISNLPSQIYFLKIIADSQVFIKKIILLSSLNN